jgi:hypothetical protein
MAEVGTPAGTSVALLPDGHWPPATGQGQIRFQDQKVLENLVRPELLDARGVSDPWSAALAFAWRLELKDTGADDLLWLLLLARYLDAVTIRPLKLNAGSSLLHRVLSEAVAHGGSSVTIQIVEWREPAAGQPKVLGGALWPTWTIFPSSYYQNAEHAQAIRDRLLRDFASLLAPARESASGRSASGESLTFKDPVEDHAFRAQIAALAGRGAQVDTEGPWRGRLLRLSNDAAPAPGGATDQLVHTRVTGGDGELWQCPDHRDVPWSRDPAERHFEVADHSTAVRCASHGTTLQYKGRALRLEDLGATRLDKEWIVWRDAERDPNLRLWPQADGTVMFQYANGPTWTVRARLLGLADVLCTPAPLPDGAFSMTLPLRLAYINLLDGYAWLAAQSQWSITLRGRGKTDVLNESAPGDGGVETGFMLWPAERPKGWRSDVVVARHEFVHDVTLIERMPDGSRRPGAFRSKFVLLAEPKDGAVEFVALRHGDNERGLVPLGGREVTVADRGVQGYIAIDFGTSNSLVLVGVGQNDKWFTQQGVPSIAKACAVAVKGKNFTTALAGTLDIFHGTHEVKDPPELHGTLLLKKRPPETSDTQWSVIPRDPSLVKNYHQTPQVEELITNLKWQDLEGFDSDALGAYLRRILLPAFLDLRMRGVSTVSAAVTYPLAFELPRREHLTHTMTETLRALCERTGMTMSAPPAVISESRAGVHAIPAAGADHALTLDMGGGTTDIALTDRDGHVLVAESLQFGARRLLALLAARQPDLLAKLARAIGAKEKTINLEVGTLIETVLQSKGMGHLKQLVKRDTGLDRRFALAAMLASVVVVTRRLLDCAAKASATGDKPSVNVYLLGQGWGLLDAELTYGFSEQSFLDALKRACADRFELIPQSADVSSIERKKLVVTGALQILRKGAGAPPIRPADYLGMDLRVVENGTVRNLKAAERLTGALRLANGDAGFGAVIDDLVAVMPTTTSDEFPLTDCTAWLNDSGKASGKTRRQRLIDLGWTEVQQHSGDNAAPRSPLVSFVSRAWAQFWLDTVNEA